MVRLIGTTPQDQEAIDQFLQNAETLIIEGDPRPINVLNVWLGQAINVLYTYELVTPPTPEDWAADLRARYLARFAPQPPKITHFSVTPTSGTAPLQILANAVAQSPDAGPVSYQWDWGDQTTTNTSIASHTYNLDGSYTITLTATDTRNLTAAQSITINVTPRILRPPNITRLFANTQRGSTPLTVQLLVVANDPEGGQLQYRWDITDFEPIFNNNPIITFTRRGTKTATVTVNSTSGLSAQQSIQIEALAPTIPTRKLALGSVVTKTTLTEQQRSARNTIRAEINRLIENYYNTSPVEYRRRLDNLEENLARRGKMSIHEARYQTAKIWDKAKRDARIAPSRNIDTTPPSLEPNSPEHIEANQIRQQITDSFDDYLNAGTLIDADDYNTIYFDHSTKLAAYGRMSQLQAETELDTRLDSYQQNLGIPWKLPDPPPEQTPLPTTPTPKTTTIEIPGPNFPSMRVEHPTLEAQNIARIEAKQELELTIQALPLYGPYEMEKQLVTNKLKLITSANYTPGNAQHLERQHLDAAIALDYFSPPASQDVKIVPRGFYKGTPPEDRPRFHQLLNDWSALIDQQGDMRHLDYAMKTWEIRRDLKQIANMEPGDLAEIEDRLRAHQGKRGDFDQETTWVATEAILDLVNPTGNLSEQEVRGRLGMLFKEAGYHSEYNADVRDELVLVEQMVGPINEQALEILSQEGDHYAHYYNTQQQLINHNDNYQVLRRILQLKELANTTNDPELKAAAQEHMWALQDAANLHPPPQITTEQFFLDWGTPLTEYYQYVIINQDFFLNLPRPQTLDDLLRATTGEIVLTETLDLLDQLPLETVSPLTEAAHDILDARPFYNNEQSALTEWIATLPIAGTTLAAALNLGALDGLNRGPSPTYQVAGGAAQRSMAIKLGAFAAVAQFGAFGGELMLRLQNPPYNPQRYQRLFGGQWNQALIEYGDQIIEAMPGTLLQSEIDTILAHQQPPDVQPDQPIDTEPPSPRRRAPELHNNDTLDVGSIWNPQTPGWEGMNSFLDRTKEKNARFHIYLAPITSATLQTNGERHGGEFWAYSQSHPFSAHKVEIFWGSDPDMRSENCDCDDWNTALHFTIDTHRPFWKCKHILAVLYLLARWREAQPDFPDDGDNLNWINAQRQPFRALPEKGPYGIKGESTKRR